MKKNKIKEISLNLTDTHKFSPSYFNRTFPQDGQADSYFNRLSANKKVTNPDEEIEDEIILKDTENLIKEISMMTRLKTVGDHLFKKHAGKIAKLIPFLDTAITVNEVYQITFEFYERLNNIYDIMLNGPTVENIVDTPAEEELFLDIASSKEKEIHSEPNDQKISGIEIFNHWFGPNQEKYDHFYLTVYFLDGKTKRRLRAEIEGLAGLVKSLIVSLVTGVDTIVALVGLLGGPVVLATELGAQLTSTAIAFILDSITIERFILDLAGNANKTENGKKIIKYLKKTYEMFNPSIRSEFEKIPFVGDKIIKYIENLESKGGQLLAVLLQNPVDLFMRLAEIYELTDIDDPNSFARFAKESSQELIGNASHYALKALLASTLAKANAVVNDPRNIDPDKIISEIEIAIIENELDIPFIREEAEYLLRDMIAKMEADAEVDRYLVGLNENFSNQKNKSLVLIMEDFLNEDENESEDEESFEELDLAEFSSAGSVAGYSLPLGKSNKPINKRKDHHKLLEKQKEINEQIERMRILEAYHQKTTSRLK